MGYESTSRWTLHYRLTCLLSAVEAMFDEVIAMALSDGVVNKGPPSGCDKECVGCGLARGRVVVN